MRAPRRPAVRLGRSERPPRTKPTREERAKPTKGTRVDLGILISDVPRNWGPQKQLRALLSQVEAAQRNGFRYISIGQHFLYGDLTWLQPVPVLARLAAEVSPDTRLATSIIVAPLYNPVLLAEELATLDIVSEGRLIFGAGIGYRKSEFDLFEVPLEARGKRFEEAIELIRRVWTEDRVDFAGAFWSLDGAEPHIRPWQSPHPPIWLGAHTDLGVRRAGRLGNAWAIPPETEVEVMETQLALFFSEQAKRGLSPAHQPLRRNILVAADRETASRDFERVARNRYVTYAQRDFALFDAERVERQFISTVDRHAVLGSAEEVITELTGIAQRVPVNPIIFRPGWPSMEPEEVVDHLDRLGSEIVPALSELRPLEPSASFRSGVEPAAET
jgi:alkanesulfonate monooxygenase SsuD/methylene tetrahydromethanopterin reductase-like flavin-dependent oxidoreductase (luciferase family)